MGIIEWLNANSGAVIAIAAVIFVGIISYYIHLTWRLLKASNTPEIVVSLRPHKAHVQLVLLCVENIGTGAAHDLQFTTNPTSIPNLDVPFEKIGFLKSGIAYFEPGHKLEQFIVNVTNKLDDLKQMPFEVRLAYRDSVNHKHERAFQLDFAVNEGFSQIDKPPLFEIAKAITRIRMDVSNIAAGISKPTILTETVSEHRLRRRAKALESRIEQFPNEVQEEILQELAASITQREQESREKEKNEEPITPEKLS